MYKNVFTKYSKKYQRDITLNQSIQTQNSYEVERSYQCLLSNGVHKQIGKIIKVAYFLNLRFLGATPCLFL